MAKIHSSPSTEWILRDSNNNKMGGVTFRLASSESEILRIDVFAAHENTKKAMQSGFKVFTYELSCELKRLLMVSIPCNGFVLVWDHLCAYAKKYVFNLGE